MSKIIRLLLLAAFAATLMLSPAAAETAMPTPAADQAKDTQKKDAPKAEQKKDGGQANSAGQPSNPLALDDGAIYRRSLAALTMLFVIAVLLENAFTTIFNWRVFLTYFSVRGVKTLVMVGIALIVVNVFNVDILANLIAVYKTPAGQAVSPDAVLQEYGFVSKFVTALILAGGSAGVYNIMHALGYRNDQREEQVAPRPPQNAAWVSVKVKRVNAVGDIQVKIQKVAAGATPPAPIAGTIGSRRPTLIELLLNNPNRFPQNGGYTLEPETVYHILVSGKHKDTNAELKALDQDYAFTKGAIVDFEVAL
jgi:hypothetical protein